MRISVDKVAELMNTSPMTIRKGLQDGIFPFGYAVKTSSRYTYIIIKEDFESHTGLKVVN